MSSDIRIDTEGMWYYRGAEMTRRDIVKLFYQHLRQDMPGQFSIQMRGQSYPVHVEDTAYVVWAVHRTEPGNEEGRIRLFLSDDSTEDLDPDTLRVRTGNVLYCRVKEGRMDARFSRGSYYQIAEHIIYDPSRDACFVPLKGVPHYIESNL